MQQGKRGHSVLSLRYQVGIADGTGDGVQIAGLIANGYMYTTGVPLGGARVGKSKINTVYRNKHTHQVIESGVQRRKILH